MASLMAILAWARWPTAPSCACHLAVIHQWGGRASSRGAFKATPTRSCCLHSLLPSLLSPPKWRTKPPLPPWAPMISCAHTTCQHTPKLTHSFTYLHSTSSSPWFGHWVKVEGESPDQIPLGRSSAMAATIASSSPSSSFALLSIWSVLGLA
jgi:hypothetical protein